MGVKSGDTRNIPGVTEEGALSRRSRLPLLAALLVCLALVLIAIGTAVMLTASPRTGANGSPTAGTTGPTQATVQYTTEKGQGATEGAPNSPLKMVANFPRKSQSDEDALSVVLLELLDENGQPAQFGDTTPPTIDMKSTMDLAVWNYDGSMPSKPGVYHPRFTLKRLFGDVPPETIDMPSATLRVTPETGAPIRSGYIFDYNYDLWMLSTDATKQRRLTFFYTGSSDQYATDANWSPDGKTIAYTYQPRVPSSEIPAPDIWVMNADGTGMKALVTHGPNESLTNPYWSSDGKYVYFTVETTSISDPATPVVSLGGSTWHIDRVEVATGVRSQWEPSAMIPSTGGPNGDIVFLQEQANTGGTVDPNTTMYKLVRTKPDGSGPIVLADSILAYTVIAPRLSPDGKWVVYASIINNEGGSNGGTQSAGFDFFKWLFFEPEVAEAHGLPWDLYIVAADGSGKPVRLTTLSDDEPHAAWLDNSNLALIGAFGLFTVKIDASGKAVGTPAKLAEGSRHSGLSWHAP